MGTEIRVRYFRVEGCHNHSPHAVEEAYQPKRQFLAIGSVTFQVLNIVGSEQKMDSD